MTDEMTLIEELNEINGVNSHRLVAILSAMNADEQAATLEALDGTASAETIAAILTRHGYQISATTIKRYRRLRITG